ncbi:10644_t:CDS:1, partial [Dentiscutata erythropus]
MNKYSCGHYYLPESFIYKGKTNKTCSNCLISKAKKRKKLENNKTETTIKMILSHTLCDYVAKLISNVVNTNRISFEIRIDLTNLKSIVRLIVDKIEE